MRIRIKNTEFEVCYSEHNSFWEYVNSGLWESDTFRTIDSFVEENSVVLDFGAWVGPVSLYVAQQASKVYAVEPDPAAFSVLEKNTVANPGVAGKIRCCNIAISDKGGYFALYARVVMENPLEVCFRESDSITPL